VHVGKNKATCLRSAGDLKFLVLCTKGAGGVKRNLQEKSAARFSTYRRLSWVDGFGGQ
jgi:hypothetical protein